MKEKKINLRECPFCAEDIKKKAKVCRFCNREVTPIFVEHSGANKQIAKILELLEQSENYETISARLNESRELRLDNKEPWKPDDIKQIHHGFGNGDIPKEKPNKVVKNIRPTQDNLDRAKKNKLNQKMFGGTILALFILSVFFNKNESNGKIYITPPFTEAQVCRAGVATMNVVSPKILNLDRIDGDVRYFSYVRRSDNTTWKSRCKISGNKIIWGFNNGRWRVDPLDTVVTFKTTNNVVTVYTTESDGSTDYKVYGLSEVRG